MKRRSCMRASLSSEALLLLPRLSPLAILPDRGTVEKKRRTKRVHSLGLTQGKVNRGNAKLGLPTVTFACDPAGGNVKIRA